MGSTKETSEQSTLELVKAARCQFSDDLQRLKALRELREANLDALPLMDSDLRKLDASVKRNTALIKKLRSVSEESRAALLDDISRTNQSKYVSEAVAAISEASVKTKDIAAAVEVISLLHQRYAEFSGELVAKLNDVFIPGAEDEKSGLARRRSALRLLCELLLVGVHHNTLPLVATVRALAAADFERDPASAQASLSLLAGFAKWHRVEFLGFPRRPPADVRPDAPSEAEGEGEPEELAVARAELAQERAAWEEEAACAFVPSKDAQELFLAALVRAYERACEALLRDHAALARTEHDNQRVLNNRGELPEEMAAAYEKQHRSFEVLQKSLASLAESLEREVPALPETTTRITGEGGISLVTRQEGEDLSTGPFEDEETRALYASLPDIRALVPALLLGTAEGQQTTEEEGPEQPMETEASASDKMPADAGAADSRSEATQEAPTVAGGESAEVSGRAGRAEVDALVECLPTLCSREECDDLAVNFCYMNSKGARKRMARALFVAPEGAPHLLAFYSRVAASLAQVFPDVAAALLRSLEEEFAALQARKDPTQRSLEARLRNARYLAELTKFRLAPFGTFFSLLKSLLDDFVGHNVDAAAALVETAGRFLYRLPETQTRISNMLEVMMKLKNSRNLDARQSMLLDNAYYAVRPPERVGARRKRRPPVHDYMRHLIHDRLATEQVKPVLRKLRRLAWAENEAYLVRCMLAAAKARFDDLPLVASLAAGLSRYHPSLAIALPDALLEEVRVGLESVEEGAYQKRVGQMRLLGELYNYRIIDSRTIFDTLYTLLTFGHDSPETAAALDPPTSYFRVRLVCMLLGTCGGYFHKGSAARKLDRFLAFFQRYILAKPPLPLDIDFDVQDVFEQLRPNMERHTSFEMACEAVAAIEAEEAAAAAAGVQADESDSDEDGSRPGLGSDDEGGRQPEAASMDRDDASESGVSTADGTADEDEEVRVLNAGKHREEDIDPDFERELAALVSEHQGPGSTLSAAPPQAVEGSGKSNSGEDPGGSVAFKVMLRKGGKDDKTRSVQVPLSAAMAVQLRNKAASEESERAEIKRLVLRANQDLDLAGLASTPRASAGRPAAASKSGDYYSRGNAAAGRGGRDSGRAAAASSRGRGRRYSAQHSGGRNP
ncbi:Regulator of nonsense transcripts 2 [Coccomyxa sp. Obi]|nr:Regulator of nonsense transcripts 2 [Coccomyxa sp. Obi]